MIQTGKNVSALKNELRNTYVIEHITDALLALLNEKPLAEISITEICNFAGVGRMSFYRNFNSKKDILYRYNKKLLSDWSHSIAVSNYSLQESILSLFRHCKEHESFYILLYRSGLSNCLLDTIKALLDLTPETPNLAAYVKAYAAHSYFGLIDEWIRRGMQESVETLATLITLKENQQD